MATLAHDPPSAYDVIPHVVRDRSGGTSSGQLVVRALAEHRRAAREVERARERLKRRRSSNPGPGELAIKQMMIASLILALMVFLLMLILAFKLS